MPVPFGDAVVASPPAKTRLEPARVDGIKRNVGADRGVHGGTQLRLVLDTGFADAARDVDERLLLGIDGQLLGGIFERGELAVGVKNVELGFVGGELAAVVGVIGARLTRGGKLAGIADAELADIGEKLIAIVREVLDDLQRGASRS